MERIKDYQIVEASSPISMTAKVKELMEADWQPYFGPVSCVNANGNRAMVQAMVKFETGREGKAKPGIRPLRKA